MPRFHLFAVLIAVAMWPARAQNDILVPGKGWELLGQGYQLTATSAVDRQGNVYCTDARKNRIVKIDPDGKISVWKEGSNGSHGIAFGPDGRLYAGQHDRKRIVAFAGDGTESVIAEGVQSHHLTVTSSNYIYFCEAPAHRVWMADTAGHKRVAYEGINWPRGIAASADGAILAVNDPPTKWVWRFDIQPDGSLVNGRKFYSLQTGAGSSDTDAGGMAFDSEGLLYVATNLGVQVFDQAGRAKSVIEGPGEGVSDVFFAGRGSEWMYVTDGERIWRRPVQRREPRIRAE
jgi:sugar lactone lactonase YvrE